MNPDSPESFLDIRIYIFIQEGKVCFFNRFYNSDSVEIKDRLYFLTLKKMNYEKVLVPTIDGDDTFQLHYLM